MPSFGGFAPYPRRLGGGRTRLQEVLDTLNADKGTAFNTENTQSVVYAENMALARDISAAWGTNERLSKLWDARRMPLDAIKRWEKILALAPAPEDNDQTRRERIEHSFSRFGKPSINNILSAALIEALGSAFVSIDYIDYAFASITVPDGSYPWGSVLEGAPWSSNTARLLVRMQKPTGWREIDFYAAVGVLATELESALPVWATFDFYRPGPVSSSVGGVTAAGFYLDDESNLDNQVLD